jgi:hydrogenase maturation protease
MKVVGVGNRFRHDDAVGLVVADRLDGTPGVEVVRHEGEPVALLDTWEGNDAVVVVDAVSSGAAAGTIHRLDPVAGPLPPELFASSTHHLGIADAVEVARALGRLPRHLVVIGVEGAAWNAGEGLSIEVEVAVPRAVEAVLEEVRACTNAP